MIPPDGAVKASVSPSLAGGTRKRKSAAQAPGRRLWGPKVRRGSPCVYLAEHGR